jgi:hypothetical protein
VIEAADLAPLLQETCPSFAPEIQRHVEEYTTPLLYVLAGELARHAISLCDAHDIVSLTEVLSVVERMLSQGSDEVQTLAIVGILEGIQNVCLHTGGPSKEIEGLLQPASKMAWDALNRGWGGGGGEV